MFLFITKFMEGDIVAIQREVYVLAVPYILVPFAMAVDFVCGILKARQAGEARTSYGFRRSAAKFREYFSVLLIATAVDILLSILDFYNAPWFTFALGAYLCFIEWKSIKEKWSDKARRNADRDAKVILDLLKDRNVLIKILSEISKNEEEEKPQK